MVTDVTLSSLMNIFALTGAKANIDVERGRHVITFFLSRHYGVRNVEDYVGLFEDLLSLYALPDAGLETEQIVGEVCRNMRGALPEAELPLILLRLMELCSLAAGVTADDPIFVLVVDSLEVSAEMLEELRNYMMCRSSERVRIQHFEGLEGSIKTLLLPGAVQRMIIAYHGEEQLLMDDVPLAPDLFRVWEASSIVKCPHRAPLYFSTVSDVYGQGRKTAKVELCGRGLNYRFPHSEHGLHDFSFDLHSGELLAIMGGSGAGKTTLLSLLNGSLHPQEGRLTINGHDIVEETARSLVGFVPQDDLLVSELTVGQNLWYVARLALHGMGDAELQQRVTATLRDLDLESIRHLKVGSALDKYISGGQRKRLNIALELIREPAVLLLDEPTSGLSSSDAERVMLLLKQQAVRGKLIITSIHQPSSDVYKLFDRLWLLDRGGYPVYDGNPIEAITYFKRAANYADADASTCPTCGNVNPEVVLNIIDEKALSRTGRLSDERKVSPEEWNRMYREHGPKPGSVSISEVPCSNQRRPGWWRQLGIQLERNVQTKMQNHQWMAIALLEPPALALISALLTRYAPETGYSLMDNKNLVTFLFMSVIVALFLGMNGAAEEIIRDRALLRRERFLQLSYTAYLGSKVTVLAIVSMVQMLLYVAVGLPLLEIQGMGATWWAVMTATALVANMTGLLLSQRLRSIVAIYITIPLLLIPQILLCGLVVDFRDLDGDSTTGDVPAIGNLIPSRWAYEALAVASYTDNAYESAYFDQEQQIYELQYYRAVHLYELQSQLETREHERALGQEATTDQERVIRLGLPKITAMTGLAPYGGDWSYASLKAYMAQAEDSLAQAGNRLTLQADRRIAQARRSMGIEAFHDLRRRSCNARLEEIVTGMGSRTTHDIVGGYIVPRVGAIYLTPHSPWGSAPMYSHAKKVGRWLVPTLWFNMAVLMAMALACGVALCLPARKENKMK